MADYGHLQTEKELAELEKRIAKLYKEAADDLEKTIKEYFAKLEKRDEEMKKLVESEEITEENYKQWRLNQIGRGKRFEALRDKIAERYTKANETAVAYVNDATPGIYTLNRNYAAYEIEQVSDKVDFTLWDESTVRRLAVEEPDLMPYYPKKKALKRGIDLDYGKKQITHQVTSGILLGEGIGKVANRLQENIQNMNRVSAIRTARTSVTGAQNAGRMDSYAAAEKMGIELQKEWLATLDNRTRHSHAVMDGERADNDKKFPNGCMYPGDPEGPPWEVYNCRCTLIAAVKGVDTSDAKRRTKDGLIPDMTYAQWEASKQGAEAKQISKIRTKEIEVWRKELDKQEKRDKLKKRIESGMYSTKLSHQQYLKHVKGTPQYEQYLADRLKKGKTPQSVLTVSEEKAQELILRYSCTGEVVFQTETKTVEYVTTDMVVGQFYKDDEYKDTKRIEIYYGKKGTHIVPVKEP